MANMVNLIFGKFIRNWSVVIICPGRQVYTLVFIPKLYLKCSYVGTSCRPGSLVRCAVTDKCPSMYCLYCLYLTSFCKQRMCYVQSWGEGRP